MEKPPPSGLGRSIEEIFEKLSASRSGDGTASGDPAVGEEPALPASPGGSGEDSSASGDDVPATDGDPPPPGAVPPSGGNASPPGGSVDLLDEPGAAERSAPSGEGAEIAARFSDLVAEYLDAPPHERDSLAPRILEAARELEAAGELAGVVDGVIALSLAQVLRGDEEALALSRELLDPDVARRIALRMGAERDELVRARLHRVATVHSDALTPALVEALAEAADRGMRRSLMDTLRDLGTPGREAALGLLEDDRWFAVRNGVVLLSEIGGKDLIQALTVPLGHEDPRVRRETVTALAKVGGEDAGLLLVGMLEDGAPEVRAAAATGVGLLRVERAQRVLEDMLETEDSEDVLVPVLRALGQLGDPGPVPAIEKRATGSLFSRPPRDVRIAAYRALGAIGTPHARTVLRNGAGDKDPEIQHAVGMILRQLAQERQGAREPEEEEGSGFG